MGRHRGLRRHRAVTFGMCAAIGCAAVAVVVATALGHSSSGGAAARGRRAAPSPSPSSPRSSTSAAPRSTAAAAFATTAADHRLSTLVADLPSGDTSVAALDVTTGRSVRGGATSGMTTASIAKVQLLETLLLQHQRSDTPLTDAEADTVTAMIENSSNDAANDTFYDIGSRDTVVDYEPALGLSTATTVPGDGDYWGLTTTSAAQELVLLENLVDSDSPLDAKGRAYTLGLMRHVEADQRWGVPAAADDDPDPAVKNGWLSVSADDDRWAVNSLGVITVDGDTVLVAVMTQHGASFDGGIDRVETLAKAAVTAVTAG